MFDKVFFVVLVLNATGLFRFIAPHVRVDIGMVSMALLAIHCGYLMARGRHLARMLQCTELKGWICLLLIWPVVTVLYAPALEVREIALQAYYVSLLCGAVVYTMANGLTAMHRVMTVSLALTVFGLVLSMIVPSYFEEVARLADARSEYSERAFGFFMQPNAAALGLVTLFLGWYSLWKLKNTLWDVVALVTFLGMTLVTGSRTGALIAATICAWTVIDSWWVRRERGSVSSGLPYAKVALFVACVTAGVVWLSHYAAPRANARLNLYDRVLQLTSFRLSDGGMKSDVSLQVRMAAQEVYWSLIKEKPLFGHGLGSEAVYFQNGTLNRSSHSAFLACWMEYGIFYPLIFAALVVRLYFNRQRQCAERLFATNSVMQIVCVILLFFTGGGGLLQERTFYVVWALFFTAVQWPFCPYPIPLDAATNEGADAFDIYPEMLR